MNARLRKRLPILPTPGLDHPRFTRLRFMSEPAGGEPAPGAPAGGEPPAPAPAPTPPAPVPAPTPAPKPGQAFSSEYVTELREEAKANRLRAEKAEADAKAAAAERDTFKTDLQTTRTTQVLGDAIKAAGGNSVAELAIKGAGVLADVDLADKAAVEAAVKAFIDEHQELKAAPSAVRSSVQHTGGSGEGAQRPTSIAEALSRASDK
ncbi:hypothetical protein ACFS27_03350 [Promicromonospora vindobonensis]|uniref:Scaffolding protein n=1 Tax=Promicromonospora vindobonensis TaxID=195748 RepID=A0ABW5VNQ4_9MICO